MQTFKPISPLQFITDYRYEEVSIESQIEQYLAGGGRWVQYRNKEASGDALREEGVRLQGLVKEGDGVFIFNDHYTLVPEVQADGVHLGSSDAHPSLVRDFLGEGYIIGATVNSGKDIERLNGSAIDYIGLGPWHKTNNKAGVEKPLSEEEKRALIKLIRAHFGAIPIVVVGGISPTDAETLAEYGVQGLAAAGSIARASNIKTQTEDFIGRLELYLAQVHDQ